MHQTRFHYNGRKNQKGEGREAPYLPFAPKNTPVICKNLDEQNQKKKRRKARGGSPKTQATRKSRTKKRKCQKRRKEEKRANAQTGFYPHLPQSETSNRPIGEQMSANQYHKKSSSTEYW